MSRFTTQRYELPFKPNYTVHGLMALNSEIQTGLEELDLLTKLKANLERIALAEPAVSSEQLMIASTLNTVLRKSNLNIALESVSLSRQFNEQVSLEGVGKMLKDGFNWVVTKIKEFFKWVRGIVGKFSKSDKEKAKQYEDRESDVKKAGDAAKEHFDNLRKDRKKAEKVQKASEGDLDEAMKDLGGEGKDGSLDDAMDRLNKSGKKNPFTKDDDSIDIGEDSMVILLKLAKAKLIEIRGNDMQFVLKRTGMYPFETPRDFNKFARFVTGPLTQAPMSMGVSLLKLIRGTVPDLDRLKSDMNFLSNKEVSMFFEETTDDDGFSFISVKREKKDDIRVEPSQLRLMITEAISILKNTSMGLEQSQKNEQSITTALDKMGNNEDAITADSIKCLKVWLKSNTFLIRSITDCSTIARTIGDDCLTITDALK